jgi:hypothetical protein
MYTLCDPWAVTNDTKNAAIKKVVWINRCTGWGFLPISKKMITNSMKNGFPKCHSPHRGCCLHILTQKSIEEARRTIQLQKARRTIYEFLKLEYVMLNLIWKQYILLCWCPYRWCPDNEGGSHGKEDPYARRVRVSHTHIDPMFVTVIDLVLSSFFLVEVIELGCAWF